MGEMKTFRKKPIVVEAAQFFEASWRDEPFFKGIVFDRGDLAENWTLATAKDGRYIIPKANGELLVGEGDYVICQHGEYHPCRADIFLETYEEVPK